MQIYHSIKEIPSHDKVVLALGFFDGCHLGHQKVFEETEKLAEEKGALPGALTFYPHPLTVLSPDIHVPLLQSREEKLESLEQAGMKFVVLITPDMEFLKESPEDFMKELKGISGLSGLVCGENFTFGERAKGTPEVLKKYFEDSRVTVRIMGLLSGKGETFSSTAIRKAVEEGRMREAAGYLGRPYTTKGDVVHGFKRGSDILGFPTANLSLSDDRVIPADGVYATRAILHGKTYPAVTNVGKNPTFENKERTIETFIFDFDQSIYGEPFTLEWIERIRGEIRFDSFEDLRTAIEKDIERAKDILNA